MESSRSVCLFRVVSNIRRVRVFFDKVSGGALKFASPRFLCCVSILLVFAATDLSAANGSPFEQRLQRLERLLANQNLVDMLTSLQALQREVSMLRGDIDLLNHELGQIKKQQKDIYVDLDQRIQDIDQRLEDVRKAPLLQPSANAGFSGAGALDPGEQNVSIEAAQSALTEEQEYQNTLGILKAGRYEEAIQGFQIYLISYPESELAANAQYWMAEAYYVLKNYESAVAHFQKVISAYPDSRKISDAYLKLGFSYYELQKWKDAKSTLDKVVVDHPNSTAARLASRRIDRMKIEGRL